MRQSKTLARIRAGEVVRICGLGHFIPSFIRHAAHFGFDCVWLDLEHRLVDEREVQSLLAFSHLCDIDIMLRTPTLEKTRLYRYLEDGAAGLMIPHVSTPEKARMLVDAVRFPPVGDRGLDGAGLDTDFLLNGGDEYPARANAETFLFVQIETPTAVGNIDEIAALDGVDGLFLGPADLGLRLKHHDGQLTLDAAFEKVAQAAARHNKAWGCPAPTPELLRKHRGNGAQLLSHGGDFWALFKMLEQAAAEFE